MLEIKANKSILLDGDRVEMGDATMEDLLISSLSLPVTLDKDLVLGNLIHILYDIREFINLYCSEEYEVGRVLFNAGIMSEGADYLRIFKNVEVTTDGFLKINIKSELENYEKSRGTISVCNLKIYLDPKIENGDEILKDDIELYADFTLLEIIEALYEDFLYSLKKDNILI